MSLRIDVRFRHAWLPMLATIALIAGCASPPPPMPAEAKVATLKRAGFAPAGDGWEISLGVKLLFETDVDDLTDEGRKAVSELARTLREIGVARIRVDGHTDNIGSRPYNAALSLRRAESVAQQLRAAGWRDDAIERRGFGEAKPVADNDTPAGRAQNRRVVIAVHVG